MRELWALGFVILAGCSTPFEIDYQTAVKQHLRDPQSAQFSDVTANAESACGFVNSKNGYGGYAGRQPFVVVGDEATLIELTEDAVTLVEARCLEPARAKIHAWLTDAAIAALKD